MDLDLTLIWAAIIGFAVVMYVVLDGFDLGIGMLFPFAADERERDRMMASVAPLWDGNETWLVLGGVGLLVAFPPAYAILMPAFYLPIIVMLIALVFRGVSFEFRGIANTSKKLWNAAFACGSAIAAFSQGLVLGGLIQGVDVADGRFAGAAGDVLTPFAVLCGFGVAAGYALLGAAFLVMKTDGAIAARARRHARALIVAVVLFMALVSLWTPLAFPEIAARWFSTPNFYFLWPVPLLAALMAFAAWRSLDRGGEILPFLASIGLFLTGFFGLVISRFPALVPPSVTIWDAAAAPDSQRFMLVGTLILLPLILGYTVLVYWLFRGKTDAAADYH